MGRRKRGRPRTPAAERLDCRFTVRLGPGTLAHLEGLLAAQSARGGVGAEVGRAALCRELVVDALTTGLDPVPTEVVAADQPAVSVRLRRAHANSIVRLARSLGASPTATCQRLLVAAVGRAMAASKRADQRRWRLWQEENRVRKALAAWRTGRGEDPGPAKPQRLEDDDLMHFSASCAGRGLGDQEQARLLGVSSSTYSHVLTALRRKYIPPLRLGPSGDG